MRLPFVFAVVVAILGFALYAAFFSESAHRENVGIAASATSTNQVPQGSAPTANVRETEDSLVRIGGVDVRVMLADTPAKRTQGLSGKSGLANSEGMLFVFPEEGRYGFWMKDMKFSIDIIWLDREGLVVHVEDYVGPDSYPASYTSEKPALYVLEVEAGFAKSHNVAVGSKATFPR